MNNTLTARGKVILSLILSIVICIIGYALYRDLHQPQLVTGESQQQAETPAGISLAAHNAKVGMMKDQLNEAAQQIALLKNKPPDTIIKTIPIEVPKIIEVERQTRGADQCHKAIM